MKYIFIEKGGGSKFTAVCYVKNIQVGRKWKKVNASSCMMILREC